MAISTNDGLVNWPVHNLLMRFFTLGSSKMEVFEPYFVDIVTTQYHHPRYVKHVLGRIYIFFTRVSGPKQPRTASAAIPSAGATTAPTQGHHIGGGHAARAPASPASHGRRSRRGLPLL